MRERPIRVYGGSRGHRIDAINVNTGLRVRNDESESLKDRREVRDPREDNEISGESRSCF